MTVSIDGSRDPHRLAAEIVHLCREGAAAAGQRRIDRMRTAGVPEEILDRFSALLPGPEAPSGRRPEASSTAVSVCRTSGMAASPARTAGPGC